MPGEHLHTPHPPHHEPLHKPSPASSDVPTSKPEASIQFTHQSARLAQYTPEEEDDSTGSTQAVEAKFITPQDPVIQTANGGRLPAVPLTEGTKLNRLKDFLEDRDPLQSAPVKVGTREAKDGTIHGVRPSEERGMKQSTKPEAPLRQAVTPQSTNPLFPPLPMYGPPTVMRNVHSLCFRASSVVLSLCFLLVIILGAMFTSVPNFLRDTADRLRLKDPAKRRPFHEEEKRRREVRKGAAREWKQRKPTHSKNGKHDEDKNNDGQLEEDFIPSEGGKDSLVCDVGYYARREGLDSETFLVQTEDGFIIELWHIYNPRSYTPRNSAEHAPHGPEVFPWDQSNGSPNPPISEFLPKSKNYPVLLIHGLLQSAGAYASTGPNSLSFYLAKAGYDVWLGNNRCGFTPRHNVLKTSDPRMWAWNIRQMGVIDLPALISRVLFETGHPKLALVAHSQGTTQTLVALAKEQRPEIGRNISVFCALAPAAYAGPLIGKAYFKFMRLVPPWGFRLIFGIHSFIPFMMWMHSMLPRKFYGYMGYRVFSFLFNWTDERWERDLRSRCFQFAPVYVSAESMRWWLGRECFARQKCILATKTESRMEDQEDREEDEMDGEGFEEGKKVWRSNREKDLEHRGKHAWYDEQVPPFALWIAGADDLVDGRRLLRRFERGREPYVEVVHSKIIEGYEHLDVIWAIDSIEKVGKEVNETIWRTMSNEAKKVCRMPEGCEEVEHWTPKKKGSNDQGEMASTNIDTAAGEWNEREMQRKELGEKIERKFTHENMKNMDDTERKAEKAKNME